MNGWIKLHRKFLEWEWYDDTNSVRVFLHLLIKANHKDKNYRGTLIKRGQLVTGRKAISRATGLTEQNVRTALSKLEKLQILTITPTSKYSLITVLAWEVHQQTNQQVTSSQPTTNQQVTTNNNINNINNINNKDNINNKKDKIPYQLIADAYNEFASQTDNPLVIKLNEPRKRLIIKLWNFDIDNQDTNRQTNNADYWNRYFNHCLTISFLNNSTEKTGDHANWRPDFDFMMKEKTYIGIREGKYS